MKSSRGVHQGKAKVRAKIVFAIVTQAMIALRRTTPEIQLRFAMKALDVAHIRHSAIRVLQDAEKMTKQAEYHTN